MTGAGGFLTTALDIPLLFALAVRSVMEIGRYGYSLDQPRDERFVLGVLIAAVSGSAGAEAQGPGQAPRDRGLADRADPGGNDRRGSDVDAVPARGVRSSRGWTSSRADC